MSLDQFLIHTCTIENAKDGGTDAHNNSVEAWDTPIENVICRLVEKREKIWKDERADSAVQTTYQLILSADADLRERAKISKVTLEDATVMSQKFTVTEILARRKKSLHHKTALLEKIS
jgi:hypothetical protein